MKTAKGRITLDGSGSMEFSASGDPSRKRAPEQMPDAYARFGLSRMLFAQ